MLILKFHPTKMTAVKIVVRFNQAYPQCQNYSCQIFFKKFLTCKHKPFDIFHKCRPEIYSFNIDSNLHGVNFHAIFFKISTNMKTRMT